MKYYQGTRSPIDACKEAEGVSKAWMHHKGRNPHHYEYWQDDFDHGGHPVQMPYEDAVEMLCDYLAAGRAYMGNGFTFTAEYHWWQNKTAGPIAMHKQTQDFIQTILYKLKEVEEDNKKIKFVKYKLKKKCLKCQIKEILNECHLRSVYDRTDLYRKMP